jgi:GrpB-like predicted nucleotidyltransferase (UPF0157 family)
MGKELSEMSLEELWELFPIILKEHNSEYKSWYIDEKASIIEAIGEDNYKRISHIGSSAVKGLISKPTVDILLEINSNCDDEDIISKLLGSGWTLMSSSPEPDFKISFNKGYTPVGFADKVFHLHICHYGDCDELYFRDYLILHNDIAEEYGALKQNLLRQYEHDRDGYTEAKTKFIRKWTSQARKDFGSRYEV